MKGQTEIIVLVVVLVLIYTRPSALVRFSSTFIGKLILLAAVVLSSLVSPLLGLLIATLMVLYTEQNYEGFKEGLDMASGSDIDTTVIGDYAIRDTMIHLIDDSTIHNSVTGEYSITNPSDETTFHENTIIKKEVPSIMIEISETITQGDDIDFTIKSIPTTLVDDAAADAAAVTAATATGSAAATAAASASATAVADAWAATTSVVATGQCSIFNIANVSTTTTTTSIIRASSLTNMEANAISALFDTTKTYLLTIGSMDYEIDTIVKSSILTLSTGLVTSLGHGADVTITKHSHPHSHTVEGMDGERDDEKEDDETKDAIKNIMDNLDIDGIIDIVKKGSDKKEGFFSAEKKNVGEVAGAFAGESYESEITGVAECTTTICERIHREEQLIRPVNSNEELQRV